MIRSRHEQQRSEKTGEGSEEEVFSRLPGSLANAERDHPHSLGLDLCGLVHWLRPLPATTIVVARIVSQQDRLIRFALRLGRVAEAKDLRHGCANVVRIRS